MVLGRAILVSRALLSFFALARISKFWVIVFIGPCMTGTAETIRLANFTHNFARYFHVFCIKIIFIQEYTRLLSDFGISNLGLYQNFHLFDYHFSTVFRIMILLYAFTLDFSRTLCCTTLIQAASVFFLLSSSLRKIF